MKCDDCDNNKAEYFIHKNINGELKDYHLCKNCAEKIGLTKITNGNDISVPEIVSSLLDISSNDCLSVDSVCKQCGLTFENFMKIGRLGCQNCYNTFIKQLEPILRKLHGTTKHRGKIQKEVIKPATFEEIKKLKSELKKAIKNEEYEKAADIRDKLKFFNKVHL